MIAIPDFEWSFDVEDLTLEEQQSIIDQAEAQGRKWYVDGGEHDDGTPCCVLVVEKHPEGARHTFAVCYGYRDELCLVPATSAEHAVERMKEHLRTTMGFTEEQIEECAIYASDQNIMYVNRVEAC